MPPGHTNRVPIAFNLERGKIQEARRRFPNFSRSKLAIPIGFNRSAADIHAITRQAPVYLSPVNLAEIRFGPADVEIVDYH